MQTLYTDSGNRIQSAIACRKAPFNVNSQGHQIRSTRPVNKKRAVREGRPVDAPTRDKANTQSYTRR